MEAFGEKVAGASARRAVRCLNRAAMVISEGVRGKIEGEAVADDEFQALRKEVLWLRKSRKQQSETESSLIQELQRRCNRIIELEVSRRPGWLVDGSRCAAGWVLPPWTWEWWRGRMMFQTGSVLFSRMPKIRKHLSTRIVSKMIQVAVR